MTATVPPTKKTVRQVHAEAAGEAPPERNPVQCQAYGCPLRGTVDVGHTGRFMCRCHGWVTMDHWQAITAAIRAHDWVLRIIREVQAAAPGKAWRRIAENGWADEPDMAPHTDETQALYVYRLVLDFEHRVGARSHKPEPMLPQCSWANFQGRSGVPDVPGAAAVGSMVSAQIGARP